jgi:hypothetical protein
MLEIFAIRGTLAASKLGICVTAAVTRDAMRLAGKIAIVVLERGCRPPSAYQ